MPTNCCVPQCNEQGFTTQTAEKYRIFPFQACFYKESSGFTPFTAKRKKTSKFPQISWSILSPRKRKAPPFRQPLVQTKKNLKREKLDATATEEPISSVANNSELNVTDKELETASFVSEEKESETKLYIKTLEESLAKLRQEIATPRAENSHLREELTSKGGHVKSFSEKLFQLERFKSDLDINFYLGFPNYNVFLSVYEFLDPDDNCKNIRPRRSSTEVSEDFYDSDNSDDEDIVKKGPQRKLEPIEEYFIVMC